MGAQDLIANSAAGANYGYVLLWTLIPVALTRYVILEATGRYVLVTGESLLSGFRRRGRWIAWLVFFAVLLKRHLLNLYPILLLGVTAHMIAPLPTAHSRTIWSLFFWSAGFSLMYWGRYQMVARWIRPLILVLGGAILVIAFLSRPDLSAAAQGLLIPSIPLDHGRYNIHLVIMALAGVGSGALGNLKYSYFVREHKWREENSLSWNRRNALLSVGGLLVMTVLVQISAASVLAPLGLRVQNTEELASLFSGPLGTAGYLAFALGLWAAIYSTVLGSNTGDALILSDLYHAVLRASPENTSSPSQQPAFRWALLWCGVSPLYVLATDWEPVWLTLVTSALMVVLLPVVIVVLISLTNDRSLMRERRNHRLTNIVLLLAVIGCIYLASRNAIELFGWNAAR